MRSRLPHLLLALALLIALGPTPYPSALVEDLQAAVVSLQARRPDLALPALSAVLDREPELLALHSQTIEAALRAGDTDLAQAFLEQQADPEVCHSIEVALQRGELLAAAQELASIQGACPGQLSDLQGAAEALYAAGAYEDAEALLTRLVEVHPSHAASQFQLGMLIAAQDPERALSHLQLSLELGTERSDMAGSLIEVIESSRIESDAAYSLAQVGQLFSRNGEWKLAALAFEAALELEPAYTEARAYLGLALDQSGGDGLVHLEQAISEAPEAPLPRVLLGKHWRARGQARLALAAFEEAAELAPQDPTIALDLGLAYAAVSELESAKAAYIQAAQLAPEDPLVWQLLAQFSHDYEVELNTLGLPAARRAVLLDPLRSSTLDTLGYSHYLAGDWVLAGRLLNQAISAESPTPAAYYHLGLLQLTLGNTAGGREALNRALSMDPDGWIGNLALRSLENLSQ
jgi:tetratricopeptide (TPR) repeat protein